MRERDRALWAVAEACIIGRFFKLLSQFSNLTPALTGGTCSSPCPLCNISPKPPLHPCFCSPATRGAKEEEVRYPPRQAFHSFITDSLAAGSGSLSLGNLISESPSLPSSLFSFASSIHACLWGSLETWVLVELAIESRGVCICVQMCVCVLCVSMCEGNHRIHMTVAF